MPITEHQDVQQTRAPSYDLDAERIVLGSVMTDARLVDEVSVRLDAEHFYSPRHAELYTTLVKAHEQGLPTAPPALAAQLADAGHLGRLGGAPYLHDCVSAVPVAAQVGHYVNRVLELAQKRRLEATGIRITQAATSVGYSAADVAALAEELIRETQARSGHDTDMVQLGALINPGLDEIEHREANPTGIKTGFSDLDKLIGGLRKKQLITVAAPTGAGKSVFLTDVARHMAIKNKLTVAMFSLEMARAELFERILAAEAGVRYDVIRDGKLDDRDWQRVSSVLGPMSVAPLFICDESEISVRQIQNKCRILAHRHGLSAVIVDYTQLVEPSRRCNTEQEQVSDVSRGLKLMAGNLDVPVIAAAQMNRGPDARADKLPQLSDLRGSGNVANNSNLVLFVHRPDYYDPESPRRGEADLVVRKARNADRGVVTVVAQLDKSRFVDMSLRVPAGALS